MILDSSAIVAIVFKEPDWEGLFDKILGERNVAIGAPTLAECGIVLSARCGFDARGMLLRLLQEFDVKVIPFGDHHWREAVSAYQRFGKGRHPAALNFGDCLTYATARIAAQPLLCTGDDFSKTDLALA